MRQSIALAATLALTLGVACDQSKKEAAPAASASAPSPAALEAELQAEYSKLSPRKREESAATACYVGAKCKGVEAKALMAAAADPAEREKLATRAREAYARQFEGKLLDDGKKPDSLRLADGKDRILVVKGKLCNRFFLENFMASEEAKVAKVLGFERLECESRGLKAGVDL